MLKPRFRTTSICVLLSALTLVVFAGHSPVLGAACQLNAVGLHYPSTVQANQTFAVTANLTVTCSTINNNVIARVDVVNAETGKIVTSNSYAEGVIQVTTAPYLKTFNVTVANTLQAPAKNGTWGLQLNIWIFADVYVQASATRTIQVQVGAPSQIVSTTTSTTATNSTAQSARAQTGVQTSSTTSLSVSPSNFGAASAALLLIAIVLVGLLAVLLRRRKTQIQPQPEVIPASSEPSSAAAPTAEHEQTAPASERVLPTGYEELDRLLRGGLPTGRAILLISGPWDEKELLFNKIIESGLIHGDYVYFLSRDLGRSQDLARKHPQRFYVLTPRADNISGQAANIFKISDIANLNDVNISISKVMEMIPNISDGKIIVIDFLSDVLLEHGGVTTRKWLDEFLTRRESEGFMVIASLNPLIVREQESQQIIDLFDGVIEIFEITGRPRRFLIVRKMSGRKYAETELSLNKDKLY